MLKIRRRRIIGLYAKHYSKTYEEIEHTLDRDHFMSAETARDWGMITRFSRLAAKRTSCSAGLRRPHECYAPEPIQESCAPGAPRNGDCSGREAEKGRRSGQGSTAAAPTTEGFGQEQRCASSVIPAANRYN
jgi:hypothetical protein